jgi:isopenicillin-N epimerase
MRPFGPDAPWAFRPDLTFLNHGSFGACPIPVLERQRALMIELEANPVAFLDTTIEARLDQAREALAAALNADPAGLVFLPNTTTGVSTVLRSLSFEPGDQILTLDHEYNATLNASAEVARAARAEMVVAHLPLEIESGEAVLAALAEAVTPRTRLAMISHITSPTGTILPIAEIVRMLDERGVDTLVDGAHAPGQVAVDLDALGAAYWTGNGHKWWCGPKGTALLSVRADRRDRIRPLTISHGWNDLRAERPRIWKEFDWTGTIDPTPFLTLPTAVDVVGGLDPQGWPGVMAANHRLALEGRQRIAAALGVTPRIPAELHGSMAIVRLPIEPSDDAAKRLKSALIEEDRIEVPITAFPVPAGRRRPTDPPTDLAVRISAQRYNEPADYDRLAEALARRLGKTRPLGKG